MAEYDFRIYGHDGRVIPVDRTSYSPPWYGRWLDHLREAIENRGGDVNAANRLHYWISSNRSFVNIVYREFFLPVCPPRDSGRWMPSYWRNIEEDLKDVILVIKFDSLKIHRLTAVSCSPLFVLVSQYFFNRDSQRSTYWI